MLIAQQDECQFQFRNLLILAPYQMGMILPLEVATANNCCRILCKLTNVSYLAQQQD
jgi:hypothetical protein